MGPDITEHFCETLMRVVESRCVAVISLLRSLMSTITNRVTLDANVPFQAYLNPEHRKADRRNQGMTFARLHSGLGKHSRQHIATPCPLLDTTPTTLTHRYRTSAHLPCGFACCRASDSCFCLSKLMIS
jgi:hypothetical protein